MADGFWTGRPVLVTGHTGFKGAWLSLWLERLGARVYGLALPPTSDQGAFVALRPEVHDEAFVDLRDAVAVADRVAAWQPEVVFHLAAQAFVLASYADPVATYATNVMGTANVLAACTAVATPTVVVVTSDKVYANDGSGRAFVETDPLGGHDPYSSSKACTDLLTQSWRSLPEAADTVLGIVRAGNVIGGGDDGPNRLLPDLWRAIRAGREVRVRRPDAVRPWQFVLEPLHGYLLLAERQHGRGTAPSEVNFGPTLESCRPVRDVLDLACKAVGEGRWVADGVGAVEEAAVLRLDVSLAERSLGWRPQLSLEEAIEWTVAWWGASRQGADLRELGLSQISQLEARGGPAAP